MSHLTTNLLIPDQVYGLFKSLGIEPDPVTWQIMDSTKCGKWDYCRRSFFYEYVLGWRPDMPSNHLDFGNAWHYAQARIHENMNFTEQTIAQAYSEAEAFYRKNFSLESDELYDPKTMANLLTALVEYANLYNDDFGKYKTHYVEVGGSVPIRMEPTERRLHFRMDTLMEDLEKGYYFCREHKTSGASGKFRQNWREDFDLRLQIGTYTHAMYCIFPKEKVRGVEVNGAFWKKLKDGPKIEFERPPCWWQDGRMHQWLWLVNNIFDEVEFEFQRLANCSDEDMVMQAFPLRVDDCSKFYGCPYHPFCTAWANPLQNISEVPPGFKIERWNPAELECLQHKMELEV